MLPFTREQFFAVFRAYNEAVWPAQVGLLALAVLALILVALPRRQYDRIVSAILAALWIWLALAYHLAFFTSINPLAYVFAVVSAAGALAFFWHGVVKDRLHFRLTRSARVVAGVALVLFALILYPVWSIRAGHGYPAMPTFGLPCPTALFTVGLLAFLVPPYPRTTIVVPVLWSLVGAQAAFLLDVQQDLGLLVAAAVGVLLFIRHDMSIQRGPSSKISANPRE